MKSISTLFFILVFAYSYSQDQNFENKTAFELKDPANFKEINNRYEIQNDTVFRSSSGFLVNSNIDTLTIQKVKYAIVTYPKYNSINSTQQSKADYQKGISDSVSTNLVHYNIAGTVAGTQSKLLAIPYSEFTKAIKDTLYDISFKKWTNYKFTTGLLTIPFKLRPKEADKNFTMTTDVTIGPYVGLTKRISKRDPYYITIPATLGLSFININNNSTSNVKSEPSIDVIPGYTWSSGLIILLNKFTMGFVVGQDFASDVGSDWIYQGKIWYSFAIGYSFSRAK